MDKEAAEIALTSAVLAGELALAGFVLVFYGIALSKYIDEAVRKFPRGINELRFLLYVTTLALISILVGAVVPTIWLLGDIPIWPVIPVFGFSISLVAATAFVVLRMIVKPS